MAGKLSTSTAETDEGSWKDLFILYSKYRSSIKTFQFGDLLRVCNNESCRYSTVSENVSHYHCKLCAYKIRGFSWRHMRGHALSKHIRKTTDTTPNFMCTAQKKQDLDQTPRPALKEKDIDLDPMQNKTPKTVEKRVLITGLSALDIVIVCEKYPKEDEKGKANMHYKQKGGNAANSAEILSRLGVKTTLFSYFEKGEHGQFVKAKLEEHGVDTSFCIDQDAIGFPTSYCILSEETFSRTVLHARSQKYELKFIDFMEKFEQSLFDYSLFHFEGRSFPDTSQIIQHLYKQRNNFQQIMRNNSNCFKISVELERVKSKDELLSGVLPYADIVFISKDFAMSLGYSSAAQTVKRIKQDQNLRNEVVVIVPWGDKGADAIDGNNVLYHCDACKPEKVLDTIGAGDTFIGGFIFCFMNDWELPDALRYACRLAGKKCGMYGFEKLI